MTEKYFPISSLLGTLIMSFIAVILICNTALLALGLTVSGLTVPLAGAVTVIISWWGSTHYFTNNHRRVFFFTLFSLCFLLVILLFTNSKIYDTSFDGQTYHSEAIIGLVQGWNPFKTQAPPNAYHTNWIGFFTKGTWITAAAMYQFIGNIEAGKVFNSLLLVASGLFSYSALSTFPNLSQRWRINLSILLMLNPISLCQLFTFYVDGQLASCLIILVSLLIILSQKQNALLLLTLAALLIIIVNIKLTAIIYTGIIVGGFVIWYGWRFRSQAIRVITCCVLASVIGIVMVGYNPIISQYTRYLIEKRDPFYPLSWAQLIEIDRNMPSNFVGKDRFWKLGTALFSKSQANMQSTELKIPFTFSLGEVFEFRYPDVRAGGFGPLFSGALLLTVVIAILALLRHRGSKYNGFMPIILILIVISILSTSEAWWARYVPQFWMLPILIVALSIRKQSDKWSQYLVGIWAFVLVFNIILVGSVTFVAISKDQQVLHTELDTVKQIETRSGPIPLNVSTFAITQARFAQENIQFVLSDNLPCRPEKQHRLIFSWSSICNFAALPFQPQP